MDWRKLISQIIDVRTNATSMFALHIIIGMKEKFILQIELYTSPSQLPMLKGGMTT
jgi:hypothetical protein